MEASNLSDQEDEQSPSKPTFLRPPDGVRTKRPLLGSSGGKGKKEANFLQKLQCRETHGIVRSSASGNPRDPEVRFFSRLPGRLAFCLRDAIPLSAIEAGHIFLGFSKCGQFLLSYTQTEADIDLMSIHHLQYHYRLHWWLFVPYQRAKKVAEITLFNNQGATGNLHLSFCQWPHDDGKVLIFGYQVGEVEPQECPSKPCHITVTAIPALKACAGCTKVAANFEEDEMAAAWNSCVRLSCLEHGMTVHTTFDLVPPYPKFEPRVSLKRDSGVVINTGNLLHYFNFELEAKPKISVSESTPRPTLTQLRISVSEQGSLFSPIHSPSFPNFSDSDCESEASGCYKTGRRKNRYPMNPERLERVAEFVRQLSPPQFRATQVTPGKRGSIKRVLVYTDSGLDPEPGPSTSTADDGKRKKLADQAYEINDDNFNEGINDKLSTFRKKRLAEKKYEFTEDDFAENVTPLTLRTSQQNVVPAAAVPSTSREAVLRPLNENTPQQESAKKDRSKEQEKKFYAKFTRRYVELDDELVSVMSGIDVDDDGVDVGYQIGGGYHSALPLEVHGSGYQAMTLIANSKAEKLNKKCVKIQQNSLDVDWFCHDMAQKLCAAAGKTYWYCNDYDVEVVDLDPASGDVICVAVVLVTATYVTQKVQKNLQISSLQRHLHQGTLKFSWNVDSGQCQLIDSEPLKELYKEPHGLWHPARSIAQSMQKTWGVLGPNSGAGNIRCFTNESVLRGTSLKTIVDTDHLVAIILDDLE